MESDPTTTQGLTRRELLKRGAVLGGALVWATPVVQLIGMTPALASHVSDVCVCLKNDPPGSTTFIALSNSSGECLNPSGTGSDPLSCSDPLPPFDGEITVTDNNDGSYTIEYPANCNLIAVSIKCGGGAPNNDCEAIACTCDFNPEASATPVGDSKFYDVFDSDCNVGTISHIEFCLQC